MFVRLFSLLCSSSLEFQENQSKFVSYLYSEFLERPAAWETEDHPVGHQRQIHCRLNNFHKHLWVSLALSLFSFFSFLTLKMVAVAAAVGQLDETVSLVFLRPKKIYCSTKMCQ